MGYNHSGSCQIANIEELFDKYFRNMPGTFVDVGAHDGYTFSNTYGLADDGWEGLCFEPIPELYEKCKALHEHNSVLVLDSCVGNINGLVNLYIGENPSIDLETVELQPWGSTYDKEDFMVCKSTRLDTVLEKWMIGKKFDLLSIDVEGAELMVLAGFDICRWLPTMIIVETHEGNPDVRKSFHAAAINVYFEGKPYTKIQSDGLNTIWVRKDAVIA